MTILSTEHGRARRYLRDIEKESLQAALKYGIKTRGRNDSRTGLPRYKFTFNNTVYITDHTCRVEVTSYKEPVHIERAPISHAMWERHEQVATIIAGDPQMCTSHTYVILDQSASMRSADVNGFRNRSQAAFGCLAIDFVSAQLSANSDTPGADSFTLIEMNDTGTEVLSQVPLDWILFNSLLDRQVAAIPKSHGNYVDSLQLVEELIQNQIGRLGDMDREDYPAFFVLFISDGQPSDKFMRTEREVIITRLSLRLKDKLRILGMGLGKSLVDFEVLRRMVDLTNLNGATGEFVHAGLSAANLADGFASISSTLTSVRTELITEINDMDETTGPEVVKLKYRESMAKSRNQSRRFTNFVQRYSFSLQQWEKYKDPWIPTSMTNKGAFGFEMDETPFGEGVERLAFRFQEINPSNELLGKVLVAKESKRITREKSKFHFHTVCLRTQLTAMRWAKRFEKAVSRAPTLKPSNSYEQIPSIKFIHCHVYVYHDKLDNEKAVLVEQFLKGKFTKFTSNNGYFRSMGHTIDLPNGTIVASDVLHAFSHWTYFQSDQKFLVCDLQGVLNNEGLRPVFELTDPAICSTGQKAFRFGKTDTGIKGMRNFGRTHICNLVCKGLGLPEIGCRSSSKIVF